MGILDEILAALDESRVGKEYPEAAAALVLGHTTWFEAKVAKYRSRAFSESKVSLFAEATRVFREVMDPLGVLLVEQVHPALVKVAREVGTDLGDALQLRSAGRATADAAASADAAAA